MKSTKQYVIAIVLALGIVIGVGSLQAAWNTPPSSPPNDNVPAPINTGLNEQNKLGWLSLNTDVNTPYEIGLQVFGKALFEDGIQIPSGSPAEGKVLTAIDDDGNTEWQTPTGGGGNNSSTPSAYFYWNYDFSGDKLGDSHNISSVTRSTTDSSVVDVAFATPVLGNSYVVNCNGSPTWGNTASAEGSPAWTNAYYKTTTGFRVRTFFVRSRDASPITAGTLNCIVFSGDTNSTYGNESGANKIVDINNGSSHPYSTLIGPSATSMYIAAKETSANIGGAVSNPVTLNPSNTYRISYRLFSLTGQAPDIRYVSVPNGRGNVILNGGVAVLDHRTSLGTNSVTFSPPTTNPSGYIEISVPDGVTTDFFMDNISLTAI